MEENTREKQIYLRTNVVDAGYDSNQFVEFLESKKQNGSNVENWRLNELKQAVQEFTRSNAKPEQERIIDYVPTKVTGGYGSRYDAFNSDDEGESQGQKRPSKPPPKKEEPKEDDDDKFLPPYLRGAMTGEEKKEATKPRREEPAKYSGYQEADQGAGSPTNLVSTDISVYKNSEMTEKYLVTKELDHTPLSKQTGVKVIVEDTQVKGGGLFKGKYVAYLVNTHPVNWQVFRRYSQFRKLKALLNKFYPAYIMPPIPKKKAGNKFDANLIASRKRFLQLFLNQIMRCPVLRSSEIIFEFLTNTKEKEFMDKIKVWDKVPIPKGIKDMKHPNGKAEIGLDNRLEEICDGFATYLTGAENLYVKFSGIHKALVETSQKYGELLGQASACYIQMAELHRNIHKSNMDDLFSSLSDVFSKWSNSHLQESELIQEKFDSFFKYYSRELEGIKELNKTWDQSRKYCKGFEKTLEFKKNKLFQAGDTTKWDLTEDGRTKYTSAQLQSSKAYAFKEMLEKETQELEKSREYYGYFSNKLNEEIGRVWNQDFIIMKDHFMSVAKSNSSSSNGLHVMWEDLLAHLNIHHQLD